jgi:uncharacterized protein YbdZ (MbtH family)
MKRRAIMKVFKIGLIVFTMIFLLSSMGWADTVSYNQNGYTLVVNNLDSSFSTTTKQTMINTFFTVYPIMAARFNTNAAKTVNFTIDPNYSGVAYTIGTSSTFSSSWLTGNPNDTDTVTHEVFHIIQAYTESSIPGWATEGLADYARYKYGINNTSGGWTLPNYSSSQMYTDSYRVTARFFLWMEIKYGSSILENLNISGRNNNYTSNLWVTWTGKTIDQLWSDYAANPALTVGYSGVTFYQDANFSGAAVQLGTGNYTMNQLTAIGIPNDWVSSLKIPNGWTVEVYQNDNFSGTQWTFTADTANVGSACNDQMTSVKIFITKAVFYQDADFGGTAVALGEGTYTLSQLTSAGIPNDWVSSIKVPSGWTVDIYQDDNYGGTQWTFTDNTSYVGSACNDQMTSVKISISKAIFYQDADFGGTAVALGKGNYTLSQLLAAGIPNDWVSSLKVPSGWTVDIYQDDNYGGTQWTFTANTSYVGSACNDQMTSVKIY